MNEYMLTIQFPSEIDQEFISLIPSQRALVNELMSKGIVTSYSLSANRQTLWVTVNAESEESADNLLQTMPLHKYMDCQIQQLMFHNSPVFAPPRVSMN